MSADYKLESTKRDGKAPEGQVAGVVYGNDIESTAISFDYLTVSKMYASAGTNHVIDLDIDGEAHEALFKEVSINSVTRRIDHIDLYAIKRGQKVTASVPVVLVGESPAESKGLSLTTLIDEVEVTTIPKSLPDQLEISKETLVEAEDIIRISDISNLNDDVDLSIDPDTVVAKVEEQRAAEAETPSEEEASPTEVAEEADTTA